MNEYYADYEHTSLAVIHTEGTLEYYTMTGESHKKKFPVVLAFIDMKRPGCQ
jgi:hypothetical protein